MLPARYDDDDDDDDDPFLIVFNEFILFPSVFKGLIRLLKLLNGFFPFPLVFNRFIPFPNYLRVLSLSIGITL